MDKKSQRDLRREIIELKRDLNKLNVQKESWFSKKENLKKDISNLIGKVKIIKLNKDKSSEEIQGLKEKREKYNKEVQSLIKKFQELNKEKEKVLKDKNIKFNPSEIIKKIESLEFKIETEGFSFEKEKSMMNQIRQFKKSLQDAGDVQSLFKELKELSDDISGKKQKAEDFHKKIREVLKKERGYSDFLELTKKINNLRKEQEEAFKKFIESKEKFSKVNERLKVRLGEAKDLGEEMVLKGKRDVDRQLEYKTREVEEKLKTKKKLTTEDLMIFQRSQDGNNKRNNS